MVPRDQVFATGQPIQMTPRTSEEARSSNLAHVARAPAIREDALLHVQPSAKFTALPTINTAKALRHMRWRRQLAGRQHRSHLRTPRDFLRKS